MARADAFELYVDENGRYYAYLNGRNHQEVEVTISSGTVASAGTQHADTRGEKRELFIDENGHIYQRVAGRYASIGSAHTPSHSIMRAYTDGTGALLARSEKGQFLAATYVA